MKGISFGFRFPGSEKHLRDLGVGWVREAVLWQSVQPDAKNWTWRDFDSLMTCLAFAPRAAWALASGATEYRSIPLASRSLAG